MRFQYNNAKSYNMVNLMVDYCAEFLTHLNFPVAYDTFQVTLDALFEFIQGPNDKNQEILIDRNFIDISNAILKLEYIDGEFEVKSNSGNIFLY